MKGKEIIIDGVDVSGCKYHSLDGLWGHMCHSSIIATVFYPCNPKKEKCEYYTEYIEKQLDRLQAQYNEVVAQNKSLQKYVRELEEKLKGSQNENEPKRAY